MMKLNPQRLLVHRVILGLIAGVIASMLLMTWMWNDILASVIGTLITLLVAQPEQLRDFTRLGFVTGVLTGPYAGVQQYWNAGNPPVNVNLPALLLAILGGLILNGFLCAAYGFLTGKFLELYKKGRGPFF